MDNICKNWTQWLKETRFSYMTEEQKSQTLNWLIAIRNILIERAGIQKGDKIIDLGCGTGLMGFGVLEKFKDEVEIIFSDKFEDCIKECSEFLEKLNIPHKASFLQSDCADIKLPDNSIDKAFMRSVLVHIVDKQPAISEVYRILKHGGSFNVFEPVIASNTRYHELVDPSKIDDYEEFKKVEDAFMSDSNNSLVNFDQNTLLQMLENAGFEDGSVDVDTTASKYFADRQTIEKWFIGKPSPSEKSMKERFMDYFPEEKVNKFIEQYVLALQNTEVEIKTNTVIIKAIK